MFTMVTGVANSEVANSKAEGWSAWIKRSRSALGLTQVELASETGLSLPTLQNLEAGRANATLDTLNRLALYFGSTIRVEQPRADWERLTVYGLPLSSPSSLSGADTERGGGRISLKEFASLLNTAVREMLFLDLRGRQRTALEALLLALRLHYPTFYRSVFEQKLARRLSTIELNGSHIKLKRIILSRLSEIL